VKINATFAKKIKMTSGLKYFLIILFSFPVNLEAFCFDAQLSSGGEPVITCIEGNIFAGKMDFADNAPVFPYYDMLLVKDDSHLSTSKLYTYFLLNYDSRKYLLNNIKYQLKNPTVNNYTPSPDYYLYMLEKIVI
jgi:hypothetical protein